jgi:hypothetical protein
MTRVTLTLPPEVAERLRATCHARGKTASDLVAEWTGEHDDAGRPKKASRQLFDDLRRDLFGG